jgi:hypothetical protein
MSNVQPVFPAGVLSWTDRIDDVNIVFAVDVNTLASDLISVENTLGANPQIEQHPPVGLPVTYSSMSGRVTDAMNNSQLPVVHLQNSGFFIDNVKVAIQNTYTAVFDPANAFNGVDITIPASGWWMINSKQIWGWWDDGYVRNAITLNGSGNILTEHFFNWGFPENKTIGGVLGRYIKYGQRDHTAEVSFQGRLNKGDRISVYSENGTSHSSHHILNASLKAAMLRTISGTFPSG